MLIIHRYIFKGLIPPLLYILVTSLNQVIRCNVNKVGVSTAADIHKGPGQQPGDCRLTATWVAYEEKIHSGIPLQILGGKFLLSLSLCTIFNDSTY